MNSSGHIKVGIFKSAFVSLSVHSKPGQKQEVVCARPCKENFKQAGFHGRQHGAAVWQQGGDVQEHQAPALHHGNQQILLTQGVGRDCLGGGLI